MKQSTLSEYQSSGVECPECGSSFPSERGMKSHHAQVHGESIRGVDVECDTCGENFSTTPYRSNRGEHDFCSHACQLEYIHNPENRPTGENHFAWKGEDDCRKCVHCGETFECRPQSAQKYCTWSCSNEHHAEIYTGKEHSQWKGGVSRTLTDYIRQNIGEESWHSIRKRKESKNGECALCGVNRTELNRRLSLHHIVPLLSGGTHGEYNLMKLCESCHRKVEAYTNEFTETHLLPDGCFE